MVVNLGPNLPVKALPNLALVDTFIIGIFMAWAKSIAFNISSSTPLLSGFLYMFNAIINTLALFLSIIVFNVRLVYLIPETINFLYFLGSLIFLIACL